MESIFNFLLPISMIVLVLRIFFDIYKLNKNKKEKLSETNTKLLIEIIWAIIMIIIFIAISQADIFRRIP